MPDNDINKTKLGGVPNGIPVSPVWIPGLGAFVLLDYRTGYDPTHLEHSVVFLPQEWDSLYDLMRAPQKFFDHVLASYSEVKGYNASTKAVDALVQHWPVAGPVTIHIEPITAPSYQNLAMLQALSTLYPGFAGLLAAPVAGTFGDALAGHRERVTVAAQGPLANPAQVAAAGAAYDQMVGMLLGRRPKPSKSVGRTGAQRLDSPAPKTTLVPQPVPFALQYVVEFALDTRMVTVRYVPRHMQYPPAPAQSGLRYGLPVTPVTRNPVKYMDFEFLHFDLDMSGVSDHHADLAERRASFAMDIIENPNSLATFLANVAPGGGGNTPYMLMTDHLTPTANPLHQKVGGPTGQPAITWPAGRDPVVVLESVLPDPSSAGSVGVATQGSALTTQSDPNPLPCVIVVYVNGVPVYIVVKNY